MRARLAESLPAASVEAPRGRGGGRPGGGVLRAASRLRPKARFAPLPAELRASTNVLLTLTQSKLEARGGFVLMNATDKLLGFDFSAPAWLASDRSQARRRVSFRRRKPIPPSRAAREFTSGCRTPRRQVSRATFTFAP